MTEETKTQELELRRQLRLERARPIALKTQPLVSVVVLNLNGEAVIGRCIEHLFAQTYPNFEILVVDNGSSDGSLAILGAYGERLKTIALGRNHGVGGGRNAGVGHARGELIAFIDNDGYADSEWLTQSVATCLSSDEIGAVASVVSFNRTPLILNGTGGEMNLSGYARDINYGVSYSEARIPEETLYPMGCGMMLRREMLTEPFDLHPVKWYDDVEIGLRVWCMGKKVVVADAAFIDHDCGGSEATIARRSWQTGFQFECARTRLVLKYFPRLFLVRWLRSELRSWFQRGLKHAALKSAVFAWNVVFLPSALALRRRFAGSAANFIPRLVQSVGPLAEKRIPERTL